MIILCNTGGIMKASLDKAEPSRLNHVLFLSVLLVTVVTMIHCFVSINFMTSVTCKNLAVTMDISIEIKIRIKLTEFII